MPGEVNIPPPCPKAAPNGAPAPDVGGVVVLVDPAVVLGVLAHGLGAGSDVSVLGTGAGVLFAPRKSWNGLGPPMAFKQALAHLCTFSEEYSCHLA